MKHSPRYKFTIIDNLDHLVGLKECWDSLLMESKSDTIFLTWEWIYTWYEVYGCSYELFIILAQDQVDSIVAIAPFKIHKCLRKFGKRSIEVLEFIGWGERVTPEYLDVIVRSGKEEEILPLLFDYLLANYAIDAIELKPFNPESGNLKIIASHLRKVGGNIMKSRHSECPITSIPSSWSAFMATKSKNFRKKMKESERVLQRDTAFSLQTLKEKEDLELFWQQLVDLHQNRWDQAMTSFQSKYYRRFHKRLIERIFEKDWLRLLISYDGPTPVAAIYCFFYNKTNYYYQSGRDTQYDKYHVGLVLINKAIQQAIAEGAEVFDFLTGNEAYKFRWADRVRVNFSLYYYRKKADYWAAWLPRTLRRAGKRFINRYHRTIHSKKPEPSTPGGYR